MPVNEFKVEDVKPGARDPTEYIVEQIYSKTTDYAVYRTPIRVAIQFCDNVDGSRSQRQRVVPLNNVRTQITGLIDGWRNSRIPSLQVKARRYEGRLAAILVMALDGDSATPAASLTDLRDEITDERNSWGRFEYLISAFVISLAVFVALTLIQKFVWPFKEQNENIWLAGRAGALGAFFSIALAIRNRTVLTNLRRRDNISDATLRIIVGTIAAGILILLLGANMVGNVTFAGQTWSGQSLVWQKVVAIGFIGGFSERLLPDLLARYDNRQITPSPTVSPISATIVQSGNTQKAPQGGESLPGDQKTRGPAIEARAAA